MTEASGVTDVAGAFEPALRDATVADLDALAALHATIFHLDAERARRDLAEELDRPWSRVVLVTHEARIAGYAVMWFVADEANLLHIAVDEHVRRAGLGARIMQHGVDLARAKNAAQFVLEVRAGNAPAIALYRRFGFEDVTTRAGYYEDGEDALVMSLRISA